MGSRPLSAVPEARAEILDASAHYEDAAGLGDAFLDSVDDAFARIAGAPEAQSPLIGFDDPRLRVTRLRRFPYHVVFAELPHEVRVLAVAHARRRPGYWGDRLADS